MNSASIISLAIAFFVLAITPGPGVLATVGRSLSSGFRPAAYFVAGILIGDLFFLTLAILGMGMIATAMGKYFLIVKILSGGYLIFLGAKLLFNPPANVEVVIQRNENLTYKNTLSGLGLTLSNPKTIIFYISFLPTFLNLSAFSFNDFIIASIEILVVIGSVLLSYAYLTGLVRKFFSNPNYIRRLNRTSGMILTIVGIVVIIK